MIFACDIVQPAPALTLQSDLKILSVQGRGTSAFTRVFDALCLATNNLST
jgi:hypothetical protein